MSNFFKLVVFLTALLVCKLAFSQNRFWVSGSASDWSANNWSATSGGPPDGIGPPTSAQNAIFNSNGLGNCTINVTNPLITDLVINGYTATIILNGNVLNVSGSANLASGFIDGTTGVDSLMINSTGNTTFSGTTFNAVVFVASDNINLNGSTFNAHSTFTKNGGSSNMSAGGNAFLGNTTFNCTGGGYLGLGNTNPDSFGGDVIFNNTGTNNMYLAHGSIGNTIAGSLTINNAATGANEIIYIASQIATSLDVTGNVILNNTGTCDDCRINFADDGDVTIGGDLTILNASTGNVGQIQIAVNQNSSLVVNGDVSLTNNGTGNLKRIFFGNDGDIVSNGSISAINNSEAVNSEIFFNHSSNSSNVYNENITIESTSGINDGIYFGGSNGSSILAAAKIISIGGGGFLGDHLYLRNFKQLGSNSITLYPSATNTNFELIDCEWGGNVDFQSARITTDRSVYAGTATLTKKGSFDDPSEGGNIFEGNTIFNNDSPEYLMMGNGLPDTINGNLTINNIGTDNVYLAYNSAGNLITGDLIINNSNTGTGNVFVSDLIGSGLTVNGFTTINNNGIGDNSRIYFGDQGTVILNSDLAINNTATGTGSIVSISNNNSSEVTINGDVTIVNTSLSTNSDIYIGNNGIVNLNGDLTVTQASAATNSNLYVANATSSIVTISGNTNYSLSGSGTTARGYFGNSGDITFMGKVIVNNFSVANNSQVYFNHTSNSSNSYNDSIIIGSNSLTTDGFYFGGSGGSGVLAATKTISIGNLGFNANNLYFRNFTQIGATPQTLLTTGTACTINLYDCNWGGDLDFEAANMFTRGTSYSGNVRLSKTGANNDASVGGNSFGGNTTLDNSGSGYFLMGNGVPDVFTGNLTLNNTGSNNIYIAHNSSGNTIGGNLTANNTGNGTNTLFISNTNGSDIIINGKTRIFNTGIGANSTVYLANNGSAVLNDSLIIFNSASSNNSDVYLANSSSSSLEINGTTTLSNSGSGNSNQIYAGNAGDVIFNGRLVINNSSSAVNSQIYLHNSADSENQYNDDIVLSSSNSNCDGILFGNSSGLGTLAATKTITVGAGGFIAGVLLLDNFTQVGSTSQTLLLTGTSLLDIDGSSWGGDADFTAPGLSTQNSTYAGTANLVKTGSSNETSNGGNTFTGDVDITNNGSGSWTIGNSTMDNFLSNLTLNNNGTSSITFASNGLGHTVVGNLSIVNTPSDVGNIFVNTGSVSSLSVGGNVTLLNNASGANCDIFFPDNGAVTITGTLTATNNPIGDIGEIYLADGSTSSLVVAGNSSITNSGTGVINRIYVGSSGNVTFNGDIALSNTSSASNSQLYLNNSSSSSNSYNGDITIESTHVDGDGIIFGNSGGSGVLAATKVISISGGGFIGGDLLFRNFTQVGATSQSLIATGVTNFTNYDSDWGGNVIFTAPRMSTRGTTYRGTSILTKTGAVDDQSQGGNLFLGNAIINNEGTDYVLMGNGSPDVFGADLTFNNTSTDNMYLAYNSAGNTIAGDFVINNNGTGNNLNYFSTVGGSTLSIDENLTVNNSGSGVNSNVYLGSSGDIIIAGNLSIINTSSATNSTIYLADGTPSICTIDGITSVINSGTGTTSRVYLGDNGEVTFNNEVNIINSSSSNNSQVYLNHNGSSTNTYLDNITVSATDLNNDGVYFGGNGGTGTLAASKTITIGAGGFIAGDLFFRNFTQIGPTPQSLVLTGTANFTNYGSNWGGNTVFTAPRFSTRETVYSGTSILTKNGAINDVSVGGNTFTGNTVLNCSGSGYFLMGNGMPDQFLANLEMNNTGSNNMYLAHNSTGNTVAGNLTVTNNGTTNNYLYLSTNASSTLTISGNTLATNTSAGSDSRIYLGASGNVTLNGTATLLSQSTGNIAYFFIADNGNSQVTFNGAVTAVNSGAGSLKRFYFGNNGDVTFNAPLSITNSSSANNSQVYLNNNSSSVNFYNDNISIEVTNANSDGMFFGSGGGSGTLAATKTITLGAGGYIAGDLFLRNFTQLGFTNQSLNPTGTTNTTMYSSNWGGNISITSPQITTRETTYNGITSITKTSSGNDDSFGNNIFNQDVTFTHNGTNRMRLSTVQPDDFNGNVTYVSLVAGSLEPSFNGVSTYSQNITFNSSSSITCGIGNGVVEMNGTVAQSINKIGATATPTFRRLTLNNSTDEITLNTPITGSVQVQFIQGNLISTTTNFMSLLDNVSAVGASNSSYVSGYIEKVGNDAFVFPVGDSGFYRPISISAPGSISSAFKASYTEINPETAGYSRNSKGTGIDHVSANEFWLLERTVGTNNVFVTLSWGANSGTIDNLSELRVAHFKGSIWQSEGNGGTTGSLASGSVISGTTVSTFSPFTLASSSANNPLPIELISFDVRLLGSVVYLEWVTESEINNDYFTIEKSKNGIDFELVEIVKGAGNSLVELTYLTKDDKPYNGVSYYRLKQTDYNGAFTYSELKSVTFGTANLFESSNLYPNPTNGERLSLNINTSKTGNLEIFITTIEGKMVLEQNLFIDGSASSYEINILNEINLPKGLYLLTYSISNSYQKSHRFIVK